MRYALLLLFLVPQDGEIAGHKTVQGAQKGEWKKPPGKTKLFQSARDFIKEPYRLGVVLVEFGDKKLDPKYTREMYQEMLFSKGTYKKLIDGGRAHGSLNDWYLEQSCGTFSVSGKVYEPVAVDETFDFFAKKKSGDKEAVDKLLVAAAEKILARDGDKALGTCESLIVIHAGPNSEPRGNMLWNHEATFTVKGKSYRYYIKNEGDRIGVHCHEFGHVLGLPDKYGAEHKTGIGIWCTMAVGHSVSEAGGGTRPLALCAWCRMRLGWLTPTVVDPKVTQKLVLRPVEGSTSEAFVIPVGDDEFYLLENRQKIGSDEGIYPGLLIWHFGEKGQRDKNKVKAVDVDLIEAHGQLDHENKDASLTDLAHIPWPTDKAKEFTPATTPAAKGMAIRNIRREGQNIYFEVGPP